MKNSDEPRVQLSWAEWLVVLVIVCFLLTLLFPACHGLSPQDAKRMNARNGVFQVVTALKHYHQEFAAWPTGNEAQIMAVLRGANPKQIIFFESKSSAFNSRGEFLDPWETPFRIGVSGSDPWAYSVGPNKSDEGGTEGSDDIVSWR